MELVDKIMASLVNIVSQDVVDIIARKNYCSHDLKSVYLEFYEISEYKDLVLSPKDFDDAVDALSEKGLDVVAELASDINVSFAKCELLRALAYFARWYEVDKWPSHKTISEIADTYSNVWFNCLAFIESGYPKEVLDPKVFEEKLYFLYTRGGGLM